MGLGIKILIYFLMGKTILDSESLLVSCDDVCQITQALERGGDSLIALRGVVEQVASLALVVG